ncbi:biotin--[acetyl-CoA-carboxylase] ligase [Flavobacterium sp.]|uniref:biotin--[acetyl-CoA-carboxylase] ligase n=1 Tax=Flavobacterium sp. TaxID=239 RepID=UPI003D098EFB
MKFIKLNAIDSTNDFLRKLSQKQTLDNFTVVTANSQWKGKGQMGSKWSTEEGKNLITSILIKDTITQIDTIFTLNITIAIAVYETLETIKIPNLAIKWPNDIMSGTKKIGGILIENSIKNDTKIDSIVGIGLNINQENFENLPKATSLKVITSTEFDIETILHTLIDNIQKNIVYINNAPNFLWEKYHNILFKLGKPMAFENTNNQKFMGIIQKVTQNGLLQILHEDDSIQNYGIKEITMLY